jgi:hypothetical protein
LSHWRRTCPSLVMHGFLGGAPNDRMSLASSCLRVNPLFRDCLPLDLVPLDLRDLVPLDAPPMRILLWDPLRPRLIPFGIFFWIFGFAAI